MNAPEAASGWNLTSDEVRRFSLPSRPGKTESEPGGSAKTILLVEDNPADAGLVREALEEHAVECQLFLINDGERALDFVVSLEKERLPCPDLVILDLNLPKRPGTDVLRRMRASRCGHILIVVLTSSNRQKDRDEAARLGASAYLQKPSRLDEFLELGRVFKTMLGS